MSDTQSNQLINYIAPAAPATRCPAEGDEPFLRPEVGFTPKWYRQSLDIDFGRRFHSDPVYRKTAIMAMREELKRRFPGTEIGGIHRPDECLDLLTGTYGIVSVAAIYGCRIVYASDNWPDVEPNYLNDQEAEALVSPDLDRNRHFQSLMEQVDAIAAMENRVEGFVNWQGVLNTAQRLRGTNIFEDIILAPERARHVFECICRTMLDAIKRLHERQRTSGIDYNFVTISNCSVNMISGEQYREMLLPYDMKIAEAFERIGIHNCAWKADPYLDHYSKIPNVAYIDMGLDSDLSRARKLFPDSRRALMYTPMALAHKSIPQIKEDLEHIARHYAPLRYHSCRYRRRCSRPEDCQCIEPMQIHQPERRSI